MRKSIIFSTLICVVFLLIISLIFFNEKKNNSVWPLANSVLFANSYYITTDTTFQYLQNLERNQLIYVKENQVYQHKEIWKKLNTTQYGASKSSVAVDDSGIYATTDTGDILAFYNLQDLKTSFLSLRWHFKTSSKRFGIHGTSALDEHSLYVGDYDGWFYSINKISGQLNWMIQLGGSIGASPLLHNRHIIIPVETPHPNGFVVKLDKSTGEIIWRSDELKNHPHSSAAYDKATDLYIVGANSDMLFFLDAETGRIVNQIPVKGAIKSTPVIFEDHVYVTDRAGYLYKVNIAKKNVIWEHHLGATEGSQTTPQIVKIDKINVLVAANRDGLIFGINADSGQLIWLIKSKIKKFRGSALNLKTKTGSAYSFIQCSIRSFCKIETKSGRILQKFPIEADHSGIATYHNNKIYFALDAPGGMMLLQ